MIVNNRKFGKKQNKTKQKTKQKQDSYWIVLRLVFFFNILLRVQTLKKKERDNISLKVEKQFGSKLSIRIQ